MVVTLLATLLAVSAPWATGQSAGEDLEISVVTFGEGDEIAEWFGHAAIVVEDTTRHTKRLYNYGEYAFDRTLIWKYLKGHLTFHVGERDVERTLALYQAKERSISVQVLNLNPAQRLAVATALAKNVRPENRTYLYDHYSDNCTTRIRDLIDSATAGALARADGPGRMTLREHTRTMTAVNVPIAVVIDGLLNDEVDRPLTRSQEAFLPKEFEAWLDSVSVVGDDGVAVPLVRDKRVVYDARRPALPAPPTRSKLALMGILFAMVAAGLCAAGRGGRALVMVVVGVVVGVPGTALTLMATATDHHVTFGNLHLMWASPVALLLVPCGLLNVHRRARRAVTFAAGVAVVVAVGAVVTFVVDAAHAQDASWPVLVCGPAVVAVAVFAVRAARVSRSPEAAVRWR